MTTIGTFPFGQPLNPVIQQDRRPKQVFVLGVYASAVHARWIGPDGKDVVKALAVASEPYIFWKGEGADEIIRGISIPPELGKLVAADPKFNGPSGTALDELYLKPLGLTREDAWLCDLVPYSCMNPQQKAALDRASKKLGISIPSSILPVPRTLANDGRRQAILTEIRESQAKALILLGDEPIRWFLRHFDSRWRRLADLVPYGRAHRVKLDGLEIDVLPLAHPRQVARLGKASEKWYRMHREWMDVSGHSVSA